MDFVRIVGDEVVRVETMKVGGQKIVRTEKEVILEKPDKDTEAKKEQEDRPANAPSLRRPGEDPEDVPEASDEWARRQCASDPHRRIDGPGSGSPGPRFTSGRL